MRLSKALTIIAPVALALALGGLPAHADEHNQLTYLTFSQSVQIPTPSGEPMVLPSGTYEFKLLDSPSRKIVQIYDADQSLLYSTILSNNTEYPAPTLRDLSDHTQLTFAQGAPGEPLTLVKWYYPGRNIGHEFQYTPRMQSQISEEQTFTVNAHAQ